MKSYLIEVTDEIAGPFGEKGIFKQVVYLHGFDHYPTKDSIFLGNTRSEARAPGLYEMELNYRLDNYGNVRLGYKIGATAKKAA